MADEGNYQWPEMLQCVCEEGWGRGNTGEMRRSQQVPRKPGSRLQALSWGQWAPAVGIRRAVRGVREGADECLLSGSPDALRTQHKLELGRSFLVIFYMAHCLHLDTRYIRTWLSLPLRGSSHLLLAQASQVIRLLLDGIDSTLCGILKPLVLLCRRWAQRSH